MTTYWFAPQLRRRGGWWAAALLVWAATTATHGAAPRSVFQAPPADAYAPTGLQAKKGYFSELPFELLDMVNGGLLLTITDLALPGDAGMDLRIGRTYVRQLDVSRRWDFGLHGIPTRVAPIDSVFGTPILIGSDGSSHQTHLNSGTTTFYTERFWKYDTTTRRLELPNGWVAQYDVNAAAGTIVWLTYVEDPYGNRLTPTWGAESATVRRLTQVVQTVGGTSREVRFEYDENTGCPWVMPSRMIFEYGEIDRVWTYGCANGRLTSVDPPAGPDWGFAYETGAEGNELSGTVTVTSPLGGEVTYTFIDGDLPPDEPGQGYANKSVIERRATDGPGIEPGEWDFAFEQDTTAIGRVELPGDDRRIEFEHAFHPSSWKWQLERKTLEAKPGSVWIVAAELTRTYTELGFVPTPLFNQKASVPKTEVIEQDGASYTTTYTYDAANFGDYHQPKATVEGARTTTRTFDYGFQDPQKTRPAAICCHDRPPAP